MRKKRNVLAVAGILVCIMLFCGCSIGETKIFFASGCGMGQVFKIGSMSCSEKEAKTYLMNYKNLYGIVYGTDLWDGDFDTASMEESLKDAVMERLTTIYALNLYAKEQEISLEDQEKDAASAAAKEYYESLSKEEKSYCKASRKDLQNMYERYVLARKVYAQLMGSVDDEVSEDEARVMDANVIFVTDEARAAEVEQQLTAGNFETLAQTYNEKDQTAVSFGRGEYPQQVEAAAFILENEQISGKIQTDDGYYFIQCVNKYNETLSNENKARIVETRKLQALEDIMTSLEENVYSEINLGLWEKISLDQGKEWTTNSFFSVIEEKLQ